MTKIVITEKLKNDLKYFLEQNRKADLATAYLFFLEKKFQLRPVLFIKEKTIYQSMDELVDKLEKEGKLWRETEIKIQIGQPSVNEHTSKIYICPYTGKVFGDNTHPNPQDAIYDWVSKCPENTDRIHGLKVKRFFVSEDPEVIKNYIVKRKDPIAKIVFSSAITGKLFNSKQAVIDDFKKNHLKALSLVEVSNQNRFNLEDHLLHFIQEHMDENKISAFVEAMSKESVFADYVSQWLEA
ncbi:MAG: DUF2709 domain-containing protein [Chlamydiae bacterium]|nr:DUF2709 domain-containing protein [Chlamydiota bacterium]